MKVMGVAVSGRWESLRLVDSSDLRWVDFLSVDHSLENRVSHRRDNVIVVGDPS